MRCSDTACGYAANTEAVQVRAPGVASTDGVPNAHVEDTPNTPSITALVSLLNHEPGLRRSDRDWVAGDTLKNVIVRLRYPDGTTQALAVGLPGDREVDMKRLEAQVSPAEVEPFGDEDFAKHPSLVKGYIGPGVLGVHGTSGVRYLVDPRVAAGSRWVTGANEHGKHIVDLVCGRDFTPDGNIEAAEVHAGDPCPQCGSALEIARGIEIGHIFQLGRKYAEALGLSVLDQNGKQVVVTMGSYGIGVSRAVAAIAETCYDDKGLCWPREVAPADVHVVIAGKDEALIAAAESLCANLHNEGVRVLLDDRAGVSPGVKFNDAELIGVPTIVVVGRGVATGTVEVKDRKTGVKQDVSLAGAVPHLVALCR